MLSHLRAAAFARTLELDFNATGVCLPCLTFIAFPLDLGDEREARRQLRSFTPDLWDDGLGPVVLLALETARQRGDPLAVEALRDVELSGPRAAIVQAIVWCLAEQMVADIRRERAFRKVVAE